MSYLNIVRYDFLACCVVDTLLSLFTTTIVAIHANKV